MTAHDSQLPDGAHETRRFAELSYERFQEMARDPGLSSVEKIGYPAALRRGHEAALLAHLRAQLPALDGHGQTVVDIGCGCDLLAQMLIEHCRRHEHPLHLVDSPEMLAHLPDAPGLHKHGGRFPEETGAALAAALPNGADAIVCYGVIQLVFQHANAVHFLDQAAALLAPGGRLLIGEIPNQSMLRRFLASPRGQDYHRRYMRSDDAPQLPAFESLAGRIDDATLAGWMGRLRGAGYDAWLTPLAAELPFANRRENLLVHRP